MKTIFVTGGSGFLGINFIRTALKKGYKVINYDIADFDYPERGKITDIRGDIRNLRKLQNSMKSAGIVFHFAAALPLYSRKDIFTTDVNGTRNVLEAALRNKIKRVVFTSSTSVYGVPDHHPLYETDQMVGVGPYGEAKISAEKECWKYRKKGLQISIIRPKSFIGPERLGAFAMFYEWAKDGYGFPLIGNGKNRYQFLDVSDLCEVCWLCGSLPARKTNDVFNIAAEKFATMREDYQSVLDFAGHQKKIKTIPTFVAVPALRLFELLKISPLYRWIYGTASKDSFVSIDKAKKVLGYKPKFSNQDALIRNYKWFLKNYESFKGKKGISHRVPWSQGILKTFRVFFK